METKHYELTCIIPTSIAETEHPEVNQNVLKILEKHEAKITDQQDLGKKKFTYAIKKIRHGFYRTIEFDVQPDQIKPISEELKLYGEVLRFLIVNKRVISPEVKARQARIKEGKIHEEEKQKNQEKQTSKTKTNDKISLEDLDEKLDEIFEGENLVK
jgi:ribosomal protein S6